MIDLNTLIPANSSLQLADAFNINDHGEITGLGTPLGVLAIPDGIGLHPFLLIPCGEGTSQSCEGNPEAAPAATGTNVPPITKPSTTSRRGPRTPHGIVDARRARLAQRYHIPGPTTGPTN